MCLIAIGKAAVGHIFIIPSTQFLNCLVIIVSIVPAVVYVASANSL